MTLCLAAPAHAADGERSGGVQTEDAALAGAREAFRLGSALANAGQWNDALGAYQRSNALRPHPTTTYNIAFCERALGRSTRARKAFRAALEQSARQPDRALSPEIELRAKGYLAEVDRRVAHLRLTVMKPDVAVSIDGRPLERAQGREWWAGTRDPGKGERLPSGPIDVLIDPGAHVIALSRGKESRVIDVRLEAASVSELTLDMGSDAARATRRQEQPNRTWAIAALGVGAGGIAVGALAGTQALRKKASLDDRCTAGSDRCAPRYQGDIDSMNRFATISSIAFAVGAIGLGVGGYLWLSGDVPARDVDRSVSVRIGPNGGSIGGRF